MTRKVQQQQLPAPRLLQQHGVKAWGPPASRVASASTARASHPQLSSDSTSRLTCTGTGDLEPRFQF
jgi:hypothetical protein